MRVAKIKHFVKSLVEVGLENDCFDNLLVDLKEVEEKISTNIELQRYLNDSQVGLRNKQKALTAVFEDFISKHSYNFIFLLLKNNRLNWLSQIIEDSAKFNLHKRELTEIICESVVPLPAKKQLELQELFMEKLKGKVVFRNVLNEKILGGLRIRIGDSVVDSSLAGKIMRLKEKIEKLK